MLLLYRIIQATATLNNFWQQQLLATATFGNSNLYNFKRKKKKMESVMQNMLTEISELHKIIKQQSEKITYNETMMAHLVTYVHSTHAAAAAKTADDAESSDDDDILSDEEEDDEDDEDANLCVNSGYETRLGDLERFVLNLEKKILELEKRQQKL